MGLIVFNVRLLDVRRTFHPPYAWLRSIQQSGFEFDASNNWNWWSGWHQISFKNKASLKQGEQLKSVLWHTNVVMKHNFSVRRLTFSKTMDRDSTKFHLYRNILIAMIGRSMQYFFEKEVRTLQAFQISARRILIEKYTVPHFKCLPGLLAAWNTDKEEGWSKYFRFPAFGNLM